MNKVVEERTKRTQWYQEARFGMFIHWGLYAIPARGEWLRSVEQLTKEAYEHLKAKIDGHLIYKRRYKIPYQSYTIELDIFLAPQKDLWLAEVEFSSKSDALSFIAPDWFGEEVTHSSRYHNSNLSQL